ncbi:hypothetical protein DUNSADRAFT_3888 [Dunaliella salina]|uniref:Encoded protein n=1 Tax=Dunaliella salina TaxID=3046 RepID=A0ABQ7GT11_DUNSA|nr:hypothetical protein DUNSADRAFT_3888 [Dunaliella salina]|eukprot:KAF5837745.1 hypothetical protein DUNSADRAFT_3888 [Dunaliella salina]
MSNRMGMKTKSKQQRSLKLKEGLMQHREDGEDAQPAVAPNLLSSYGERFMSMFDDYDEGTEVARRQRELSSKNAGSTCSEQQRHTCKQEGLPAHGSMEDPGGLQHAGKSKEKRGISENSSAPRHAKKGRGAPKDEIEEIIFNDKPQSSSLHLVPSASVIDHPRESLDLERRLFMSSKVGGRGLKATI